MDNDIVNNWIEDYENSNRSLSDEIRDIVHSISNENIWMLGSDSDEARRCHADNISNMAAYLDWLLAQDAA